MTLFRTPVPAHMSGTPSIFIERNSQAHESEACSECSENSQNSLFRVFRVLIQRILGTAYRDCGYVLSTTPQSVPVEGWPQ